MKLKLRRQYTQTLQKIDIYHDNCILFLSDNLSLQDFTSHLDDHSKIFEPMQLDSRYLNQLSDKQIRSRITKSFSLLKNKIPIVYDLTNYIFKFNRQYKMHNKTHQKYLDFFKQLLDKVKKDVENYKNVYLDIGIDSTKFDKLLTKSDLKNSNISTLYYMFKKNMLPFKTILLTVKNKYRTITYMISDGRIFDINRTLQLINANIKLNKIDKNEIQQKIDKALSKVSKFTKNDSEFRYVKMFLEEAINNNPDVIQKIKDEKTAKQIVVEYIENLYDVKLGSYTKAIQYVKEKVPPPVEIKLQFPIEKIQHDSDDAIVVGNTLNLRSEGFKKTLLSQLRHFSKYYEEKYNIKVTNIRIKKEKTDSVFHTEYNVIEFELQDLEKNKKQTVRFQLPDLTDSNYIKWDGIKRVLTYQLYSYPIYNPIPHHSMLKTNYASIEFFVKTSKKQKGIYVYISGEIVPALDVLFPIIVNSKCKSNCSVDECVKIINKYFKTKLKIVEADSKTKGIKIGNKVIIADENDKKSQYLLNSFLTTHKRLEFKTCSTMISYIKDIYGDRLISSFVQIDKYIIDPITAQILKEEKKPTDTFMLYNECIDNAIKGYITDSTTLRNKRVRVTESLTILLFKKLTPVINEIRTKKRDITKIKVNERVIINELLSGDAQSQLQLDDDLNPLKEVAAADLITQAGYQGINAEFAKMEARSVDSSFYGNIDPVHTPDSGNVGVVRHLALNSIIKDNNGSFVLRNTDSIINPFSVGVNYNPFPINTDGNRIQYGVAQMGSDIPLVEPELPYVMSKYSNVFTKLVSSDFVIRAKDSGKVLRVTDNEIVIKYDNQTKPVVIHFDRYSIHSNKDMITTNIPVVKEGDVVNKDDSLVVAREFFKNNNLMLGRNLYTLLKPHKIMNFEDGFIIREGLSKLLESHHGDEMSVLIKENEHIHLLKKEGDTVTKDEPILVKLSSFFESVLLEDEDNKQSDLDIGKKIYPKIDGEIIEIRVYAKDEQTLEKYPALKQIYIEKIKKLKNKISEYQANKYDTTELEKKLEIEKDIFGKKYKGEPITNILIFIKIRGTQGIKEGDKLHNRHGKLVAA